MFNGKCNNTLFFFFLLILLHIFRNLVLVSSIQGNILEITVILTSFSSCIRGKYLRLSPNMKIFSSEI